MIARHDDAHPHHRSRSRPRARRSRRSPRRQGAGTDRPHPDRRRGRAGTGADGAARRVRGWSPAPTTSTRWSATTNVKWRVAVPGQGHSSPIVWKDHIFLTTATRRTAAGSRCSRTTASKGKLLWETAVPSSGVEHVYWKNSHASATPTTDGERIYASFGTHGLAAFDFSGKLAVAHRSSASLSNYHGSAGSPVLYKDRVFLYQDHSGSATTRVVRGGVRRQDRRRAVEDAIACRIGRLGHADRDRRRRSRRADRQRPAARSTPTIPRPARSCGAVSGNTREVIPTPVVGHGLVFCSSGRAGPTLAIKPGGKGDVTATHVGVVVAARVAVRAVARSCTATCST